MEATSTEKPVIQQESPLVFAFSKSEAKGTQSWINAHRLSIFAGMTGGISMFISGVKHKNPMRKAAAVVTMYGMIADLIFADKKNPTLGELTLAHGDWMQSGAYMESHIAGKIPEQVKDEMNKLLEAGAFPKDSVLLEYDKKSGQTKISVKTDVFQKVQDSLQERIASRQHTFSILLDPKRQIASKNEKGAHSVAGLSMEGVQDKDALRIKELLRHEFNIHGEFELRDNEHMLTFDRDSASAFMDITSRYHADASHITIRSGTETDYAPGFIESITRPDKHPKQHGVMIGGILSNALRIGAGLWEEQGHTSLKDKRDLWESMSSVWSMMTYLIDLQPEIKKKDGQVVAYSQVQYGPVENIARKVGDTLDDRPLLGSLVVKAPVTYMRVMSAWQPGRDDPMKKINAISDGVRHLLTATIHKGDYGK